MSEIQNIADLFRRSAEGPSWYGPNPKQLLADVSAVEAVATPITGEHSIWREVLHMIVWRDAAADMLDGGPRADFPYERHWPAVTDESESSWQETLAELDRSQARLAEAIGRVEETCMHEPVPAYANAEEFTFYDLMHSIMQHDAYHAGQIALLKRAVRQGDAS